MKLLMNIKRKNYLTFLKILKAQPLTKQEMNLKKMNILTRN